MAGGTAATWPACSPACSSSTSPTPASPPNATASWRFLAGLLSQSRPGEACIHFVGVHPAERGRGLGRQLYQHFFAVARARGAGLVRAVTAPVNHGSIRFHQQMGFGTEPGDTEVNGIPVATGYDGDGQDRVRFINHLTI